MGTHHRGTAEEGRALDAFITLMRAAESLSTRTLPPMVEAGLTAGQFGALEALLHLGPLCQREIGRKLLRTGGNVTLVVDNLERRGLVRRRREPGDRRYVRVELTDPGRRLVRRVFPRVMAIIVRELKVLSTGELRTLRALCRRVGLGIRGINKETNR